MSSGRDARQFNWLAQAHTGAQHVFTSTDAPWLAYEWFLLVNSEVMSRLHGDKTRKASHRAGAHTLQACIHVLCASTHELCPVSRCQSQPLVTPRARPNALLTAHGPKAWTQGCLAVTPALVETPALFWGCPITNSALSISILGYSQVRARVFCV